MELNAPRLPLQVAIKTFSAPLLFLHEQAQKEVWGCGGTVLLWQTLEGLFFVGAAHVWRELVKMRNSRSGRMTICVNLGDGTLVSLLEAEPLDIDDEIDVVVLRVPPEYEERIDKKRFYCTSTWPLPAATDGETVGVMGFPGEMRKPTGLTVETLAFYYQNTCAVSPRTLLIGAFPEQPPVTVSHVDYPVQPPKDFGGISGAPVFALRRGKPVWVGVVKRGAEDSGINAGLQASPSHFVQADGKLRLP